MTNKQIGLGLGLLALAVVGVIIYNKKKNKKEEEKSGFVSRISRDVNVGKYSSGNAGRKECIADGGTVSFPNSGGWICNLPK